MTLNRVVLPEPLGPINPVMDPFSTTREHAERAWMPPKALETLCTSNKLMCFLMPLSFLRERLVPDWWAPVRRRRPLHGKLSGLTTCFAVMAQCHGAETAELPG